MILSKLYFNIFGIISLWNGVLIILQKRMPSGKDPSYAYGVPAIIMGIIFILGSIIWVCYEIMELRKKK